MHVYKIIFKIGLILLPIVFLSIKHATNTILFFLSIISLVLISDIYRVKSLVKFKKKPFLIAVSIFISPILAIVVSQLLRQDFFLENWDSPLRFFLCLPIFFAISQGCSSGANTRTTSEIWLCWSFPVAIFVALISRIYYPSKNWGAYLTTYFVDPLSFCSYTLLFSILSIIGLVYFHKKISAFNVFFSLVAIMAGFYLSITSGARTGWLGLPLILIILWYATKVEFDIIKASALILVVLTMIGALVFYNSGLINKLFLGFQEFMGYRLNELNKDTSVGMRLSFYRMGIHYFIDRPWYGWGDLSWMNSMDRPEFVQYASEFTRQSPKHGFHNEIITSCVRSGVWGLMASVCLFAGGLYLTIKGLCIKKICSEHRALSLALFVVTVHLFFAGFTTEITNLTFLSAFIGIIFSVLLGEKLYLEESCLKDTAINLYYRKVLA